MDFRKYNDLVSYGWCFSPEEAKKKILYGDIVCGDTDFRFVVNTWRRLQPEVEKIPRKKVIVNYFDDVSVLKSWPLRGGNLVTPTLFISSYEQAGDVDFLRYFNIQRVINLSNSTNANTLPTLHIQINDITTADIKTYFAETNAYIDGYTTLVHCQAGVSRSATICIAYIMWKYKAPLRVALHRLQQARSIVEPNPGFMAQLREYEQELKLDNIFI